DGQSLNFKITAVDGDGDDVELTLSTRIIDDEPVVSNPNGSAPGVSNAIVAEAGTADGTDAGTGNSATGSLKVDFGADGFGSVKFSGLFDVPNEQSGDLTPDGPAIDTGLTSNGVPVEVTLSADGLTLTGTAGGQTIFEAELDADSADYTVTLSGPIDHHEGAGNRDDGQSLNFKITAVDGDGDDVELTLSTRIIDDEPVVSNPNGSAPGVSNAVVAEAGTADGTDAGTGTSATGSLKVDFGADGFGSVKFSGLFDVPNEQSGDLTPGGPA
ncbi:DUF5801 repeats-in-toxin domain-containing protein, partial [Pseudovibrio exalbescens]|uniref:T1SS-143 repeat domain-containing protein n=1 Tax=Pseudovibrio exalbescens TaxID=197461 RepID=UPI000B2EA7AF